MTVLLVILTFAVLIGIDALTSARKQKRVVEAAPLRLSARPEPVWVAGYDMPDGLHYHRGHTWVRVLEDKTVVVGLDDFARRLLGEAQEVMVPAVGAVLEQGGRGFGVRVDGRTAELVSPIGGDVLEVNPALREQPRLATDDPYGRGWIARIEPERLTAGLRNLLCGRLARRWIEDAREGLDLRVMALSGSVLQDGGEPTADFGRHLPDEEWRALVHEFLLT